MRPLAISIAGGLFAVVCGVLLSAAPLQGAVLLLGLLLFAGTLLLPWPALLAVLLVTVGFVVGPLQYAAGISKAFWLPYLLGVLMGLRLLAEGLGRTRVRPSDSSRTDPVLQTGWVLLAVLAMVALASSLAHGVGALQALISGKEYLFLWSLPLAFALGVLRVDHLRLLWPALALWLAVQSLVVVWQRLVIAPRRGGDAPWDAVVGLFAGNAFGAGGSGTMALVSLWAAAAVALAWRAGLIKVSWALLAAVAALLACALAEVKVAIALVPLLALWVLLAPGQGVPITGAWGWNQHARLWVQRMLGLGSALLVAGLLMWAHQQQFSVGGSREASSSLDYAQTALDRNLDHRDVPDEHGQLTRLGALQYWWRRQSISDLPGAFIGHGVGSIRRSSLSPGKLVQGLRFEPARSSAAVLLWETGLLGLLAWVGSSVCWLVTAWRLGQQQTSALQAVSLQSGAAIITLTLLSLVYGADWFEAPHLAVAYLLGVGMVWGVHRELGSCPPQPLRFPSVDPAVEGATA